MPHSFVVSVPRSYNSKTILICFYCDCYFVSFCFLLVYAWYNHWQLTCWCIAGSVPVILLDILHEKNLYFQWLSQANMPCPLEFHQFSFFNASSFHPPLPALPPPPHPFNKERVGDGDHRGAGWETQLPKRDLRLPYYFTWEILKATIHVPVANSPRWSQLWGCQQQHQKEPVVLNFKWKPVTTNGNKIQNAVEEIVPPCCFCDSDLLNCLSFSVLLLFSLIYWSSCVKSHANSASVQGCIYELSTLSSRSSCVKSHANYASVQGCIHEL